MWRNLSYKKKVVLSGLLLLAVLLAGYRFSFSKTIALYQENQKLGVLTGANEAELIQAIAKASQKKQQIDSLQELLVHQSSVSGVISALFEVADRHNLVINGINDSGNPKSEATFYYFQFSGMYINMVKLLRSIEESAFFLNIVSVEFVKEVDRRTQEERLFLNLTLTEPGDGN